jgi:glycosyltransferase involved in cell wall biosynthesis
MSAQSTTHQPVLQEAFEAHKACVLIPTYNNSGSLPAVLEGVLRYTTHIILINDGSTDNAAMILQQYPQLTVMSYPVNRGKGYALRQGFKAATAKGYDYAISIDADGQHYPDDLAVFIEQLATHPNAIMIGARNMQVENVPGKSSFGNRFSNFWFWLYTGIKAPDTQSGYRLYPVKRLSGLHFFTRKYEFEVEVLVRGAWAGLEILSLPVKVYYPPREERVSHFRPFKDFTRISILNTILFFIAFLYIKPRDFIRAIVHRDKREQLMQKLLEPGQSAERKALSIGFGIFMGIVPIWGFQLIVGISLAMLLRLNKALVITAANISIPPMIPFILYGSFLAGSPWMGSQARAIPLSGDLSLASIHQNLQQYLAGSITLAILAGLVTGLLAYLLLKNFSKKTGQAL